MIRRRLLGRISSRNFPCVDDWSHCVSNFRNFVCLCDDDDDDDATFGRDLLPNFDRRVVKFRGGRGGLLFPDGESSRVGGGGFLVGGEGDVRERFLLSHHPPELHAVSESRLLQHDGAQPPGSRLPPGGRLPCKYQQKFTINAAIVWTGSEVNSSQKYICIWFRDYAN